jgi:flagellar hook-associated protein 3 FlgL
MRVTEQMIFNTGANGTAKANERVMAAQAKATSGRAFTKPGDDPVAAGSEIRSLATASHFQSVGDAVSSATSELQTADGALNGIGASVTRARELALQLSSGTWSAGERSAGAKELQGIIDNVVGLLNTKQGSRYLFGGTADAAPPFTAGGAYQGNSDTRTLEVAPGIAQDVSVRTDDLMTAANGGTDLLGTLQKLQTALASNDAPATQATLDGLQAGVDAVAGRRGELGSALSVLGATSTASQTAHDAAAADASKVGDADMIGAYTKLTLAQQALQASIQATSQSFQFSLLTALK